MRSFANSVLITTAFALSFSMFGWEAPKIHWGKPAQEWRMGISATNTTFTEGFPSAILLYFTNESKASRYMVTGPMTQQFKVAWSADSGETSEKRHSVPFRFTSGSPSGSIIETNAVRIETAFSGDILSRLPVGHGKFSAYLVLKEEVGVELEELASGELDLRILPRVESDPPPSPLPKSDEELGAEMIRIKSTQTASNIGPAHKTPGTPSSLIKSGTPSMGQKSGTSTSPVIATVSAGESPGSIFTPRNLIGATVVLGLLAIIASVLVRARSRQNSPP